MAEVVELFLHHHHLFCPRHDPTEEEVEDRLVQALDDDDDDGGGDSEYWSSSPEIHQYDHAPGVKEPPAARGFLESAGSVGARVLDRVQEIGSDFLGLGVGSFGFDRDEEIDLDKEEGEVDNNGEDFSLGGGDEGLRIVQFDSGSEEGEGDVGGPLQWDCLRIEDARRDVSEEFEWEEVDDRVFGDAEEEREVVDRVGEFVDAHEEGVEEEGEVGTNVEWEVLLTMNHIERNSSSSVDQTDFESFVGEEQDHDDYVYPSEYDILFGQFVDQDGSFVKRSPPTARFVVEGLPSVVSSREDVENGNALCAVCKDDIVVGESVKQLPCLHHYHEDCILPWLGMRNTCPVCRHELPSDDPDYESSRASRAIAAGHGDESRPRYMFGMVPVEL